LRRKTPEAQNYLLSELEGLLRQYFPEAHDAGSYHPGDGRAELTAAAGDLTESAKNEKNSSVCFFFIIFFKTLPH
jgi:hypothetical protein